MICAPTLSSTGARLAGLLLPVYRGQLTGERRSEHGGGSECHVRAAPDSQAQHEHLGGAGERASEENQLVGTHADEQFKAQSTYNCIKL